MKSDTATPTFGNVVGVSKDTRGWFLGQFMPGEENPLRSEELELKWETCNHVRQAAHKFVETLRIYKYRLHSVKQE